MALAACAASPQPNPALEQAQARVAAAGQDATVAQQAPLELQRARQYLDRAESSWQDGAGQEVVTHEAYMAAQQAEIARQTASARQARAEVAGADAERSKTLLAARTREAQELRQKLEAMEAQQTDRGLKLTLGDFLFKVDSAELLPGAASRIDQLASVLRQHPEYTVEIDGFTDSTGSETYNLRLSRQRAETIWSALTARGVDPTRIVAQGHGETVPVASNQTQQGRQLNRRVEVLVAGPGLTPTAQRSGTATQPPRQ